MGFFSKQTSNDIPRRRQSHSEPQKEASVARYAFKRSRTLISSTSRVDGAVGNDVRTQSARERTHELINHRRQLLRIFSFIMIGVLLLTVFMWQFIAAVTTSATDGVAIRDNDRYKDVIGTYLGQRPAERFRVSLDEAELIRYMSARLPEVQSVRLASPAGVASSHIEITMRKPVAGWNINGSQRFVDAEGVAFDKNYYASPPVQVIDNSGIPADSGASVASGRFLSFVGLIVSESSLYDYRVTSIVIPPGTTRQVEARLGGVDFPIRFSIDRPVGEQVEDMARSIGYMRENSVSPEYIDVRVSRRAYYR